ncbi:MAG: DUF5996 family protein [Candidatus Eremiobacteraeota bacterium]|nr:DUF5996 family protein [Candidatus Eremiobacteraeota bacterium]
MNDHWPVLPLEAWKDTCDTLHLYAQIVGKVRLALAPPEPQWAHVPLYVTARGLTTSPMPCAERTFAIDFDFIAHKLLIGASDGQTRSIELKPRSVADFYAQVMEALRDLAIDVSINPMPQEIASPIPFTDDRVHAAYDAEYVNRFWRILSQVDAVFKEHRAPFRGRQTVVQFFWGSFDLAYARFSGRPAQAPSGNVIMRKGMDAEEIAAGFWPGDDRFPEPAFWSYAYPKPAGVEKAKIGPQAAAWNAEMGEFMLRYEDVRSSESPRAAILEFLSSTYEACAALAGWDLASR